MHDITDQIDQNITAGTPDPEMTQGFGTGVMNPLQFLCCPESCLIKMTLPMDHWMLSFESRQPQTQVLGPCY